MKYELNFVCESDGDVVEQGYDVEFFYNPNQYGNGTYMSCKNHKAGYANYNFDIRYNKDYHPESQVQFIVDWVMNTWNGKNGSYKTTAISVKEKSDEQQG